MAEAAAYNVHTWHYTFSKNVWPTLDLALLAMDHLTWSPNRYSYSIRQYLTIS